MEALAKVIFQVHRQWGIDCKSKGFALIISRLMRIGVIGRPGNIFYLEMWDRRTKVLAEEAMSSGSGWNLKLWGRFVRALQKTWQEREL